MNSADVVARIMQTNFAVQQICIIKERRYNSDQTDRLFAIDLVAERRVTKIVTWPR